MVSVDNYYDHYKDTFSILKGYLKKRDTLTIVIFLMIIVILFQIQAPCETESIAKAYIDNTIKGVNVDFKYINSVVHIVFLWVVMQYYQITLTIEKNYDYLHEVESKLSSPRGFEIKRESVNYLDSYPWLKSIVNIIYKLLFPILIIATALLKIVIEYGQQYEFVWFDTLILGLIVFLSLLYLSNRFFNEVVFDKKKYPNLCCCKRLIKYFWNKNE